MPSWKKVIVSGSDAILKSINVSGAVTASIFSGSHIGPLTGTASWATNALTASYVNPLRQNVIITGSLVVSGSGATLELYGDKIIAGTVGGDEGGEILLGKPQTNTTLTGSGITVDSYQNKIRFFEQGGAARGAYIDITACAAGVGTNLLSGGGGATFNGGTNVDNRLVTATGTTPELNGEANLTFNGSTLAVTGNVTATSITGSLTGSLTGELIGTSSWATQAISSSFVRVSSSNTTNANFSLIFADATPGDNYVTLLRDTSLNYNPNTNTLTSNVGTASFAIVNATTFNGTTFNGALNGTASWATNALTASTADAFTVRGNLTVSGSTIIGDATTDSITMNAATMSLGSGTGILNIDSNTFVVDGANNRVGVRTSTPAYELQVSGNLYIGDTRGYILSDFNSGNNTSKTIISRGAFSQEFGIYSGSTYRSLISGTAFVAAPNSTQF